tara:strand:+ start:74 stop:223 length:150 start_codon:yes stop_codon:yes gene_type:complete
MLKVFLLLGLQLSAAEFAPAIEVTHATWLRRVGAGTGGAGVGLVVRVGG